MNDRTETRLCMLLRLRVISMLFAIFSTVALMLTFRTRSLQLFACSFQVLFVHYLLIISWSCKEAADEVFEVK